MQDDTQPQNQDSPTPGVDEAAEAVNENLAEQNVDPAGVDTDQKVETTKETVDNDQEGQ